MAYKKRGDAPFYHEPEAGSVFVVPMILRYRLSVQLSRDLVV